MSRNEEARKPLSFTDRRSRAADEDAGGRAEPRTIVIRHGSGGWQSLAFLLLCLLLGAAVLLGHWVVRDLDRKNQESQRRPGEGRAEDAAARVGAHVRGHGGDSCSSACATTS